MTKIISVSLNEPVLKEIDFLTNEMDFSGRSETIRAGIRLLSREVKEHAKLKGIIHGTLSVVHYHRKDINLFVHQYQGIIMTHLHNHLNDEKCLDIFVLKGNANEIRKLLTVFESDKRIESVKFNPV